MVSEYMSLECSECGRTVRQRRDDVVRRPFRICPGCGEKIDLTCNAGD